MTTKGRCRLCHDEAPLQLSHVLPAFVTRWLRETSVGHIRMVETPNRRVQDGPKAHLLCTKCEQVFSGWEKAFAERIFEPFHASGVGETRVRYQDWALEFATSVSWR